MRRDGEDFFTDSLVIVVAIIFGILIAVVCCAGGT